MDKTWTKYKKCWYDFFSNRLYLLIYPEIEIDFFQEIMTKKYTYKLQCCHCNIGWQVAKSMIAAIKLRKKKHSGFWHFFGDDLTRF